ncbi:MAG: thiol reductase thioredoxin [Alphaproteobacteria bacterium]|nr:MAG: thiol reductase thioredoxin [Alphaproteobacteria bacterium]
MHGLKHIVLLFLVGMGMGTSPTGAADREILVGEITPQDLREVPYGGWYREHYEDYEVQTAPVSELPALLEGVDVIIVMGTWCPDSQRQVPPFYKILTAAGVAMSRVDLWAVDMDFAAPDLDVAALGITNTPTFIFSRNGKELNRIVESPVESLEQDMLAILKGAAYRHAKLAAD